MIANPEVADVFRKRAKVHSLLPFSFFLQIFSCMQRGANFFHVFSRLYLKYGRQWNLLALLKLKHQFFRYFRIYENNILELDVFSL